MLAHMLVITWLIFFSTIGFSHVITGQRYSSASGRRMTFCPTFIRQQSIAKLKSPRDNINLSKVSEYQQIKMAFSMGSSKTLATIFLKVVTHGFDKRQIISKSAVLQAACKGRANTVAVLLKLGIATAGSAELFCAMNSKHPATALAILTHGHVSINVLTWKDSNGKDAITLAVESPNVFVRVLQKLLELRVDGNAEKSNRDTPLILAIKNNASAPVVDLLLKYKADVNHKNAGRETALHWACRNNLTNIVRKLLDQGANVMAIDAAGNAPLHWAAQFGASNDIILSLLKGGAFIEVRNVIKRTPLMLAAASSVRLAELLLNNGAEIEAADLELRRALELAIENQAAGVVELLLNHGSDPNTKRGSLKITPLITASEMDPSGEIVEILLRHKANMEDSNGKGDSALHCAGQYNNKNATDILLRYGANVNKVNADGFTPLLTSAAANSSSEILELLIKSGATVNATAPAPRTDNALMQASYFNNVDNVRVLLKFGANVNAIGGDRMTALNYACQGMASVEVLEILIRNGADLNVVDSNAITPLMASSVLNQVKAVAILLENGADPNIRDYDNFTSLLYAAWNNCSAEIIKLTLQHSKVEVNAMDRHGMTALMYAAQMGNIENARVLIDFGADISLENAKDNNFTAVMYAIQGHASSEIIRLLLGGNGTENSLEKASDMVLRSIAGQQSESMNVPPKMAGDEQLEVAIDNTAGETVVAADCRKDYPLKTLTSDINAKLLGEFKSYRLQILTLLNGFYSPSPNSTIGFISPNSRECLLQAIKAMLVVIDSGKDILPNYAIEVHYYDGVLPLRFLPQIQDNFIAWQSSHNTLKTNTVAAPITLGPLYDSDEADESSVQLSMQKGEAAFFQSNIWGKQNTFFEYSAYSDSQGTDYQFYSGELRHVSPETVASLSLMGFLKSTSFGFKWQRIALLADTRNAADLVTATNHNKWLLQNGFTVDLIVVSKDYYESFLEIKQKGRSRILFFSSYLENCEACYEIWCSSHRAGLKPDKSVFLLLSPICMDICFGAMYDANCSLAVQQSQMAMAFFAMQLGQAKSYRSRQDSNQVYDFARSVLGKVEQPNSIPKHCAEYNWGQINDAFLQAVFLLHTSDQKLQERYGVNLHYAVNRNLSSWSKIVQQVIYEIASEYEISKQSIGRDDSVTGAIVQGNFDIRKADNNGQRNLGGNQSTWNGKAFEWRVLAKVKPLNNDESYNFNLANHSITPLSTIIWATSNREPPKDLSQVLILDGSYHEAAFHFLIAATCFLSICQILLGIFTAKLFFWNRKNRTKKENQMFYFDYGNNLIVLVGCCFVNISAFTVFTGTEFYPNASCMFMPIFSVFGMTLINSMLFSRMFFVRSFAKENRYISRKYRKPNLFNEEFHEKERKFKVKVIERKTRLIASVISMFSLALTVIWLASDPIELKWAIEQEDDPPFDIEKDTFYTYRYNWCESESQLYWIIILALFQVVLLAWAAFLGIAVKHSMKLVRRRWKPEIGRIRMAINNALTIILFVVFLIIVVPSKPASLWYLKRLCFAVGELLYSASTGVIIFYHIWSPVMNIPKKIFQNIQRNTRRTHKDRTHGEENTFWVPYIPNNVTPKLALD